MKQHFRLPARLARFARSLFVTLVITSLSCLSSAPVFAEASAADRAMAGDEFRRGVQSYYRGAFNDSIMIFEKALSFLPGEPLILDWLGKAYYRTGVEGAALQQWQYAVDAGYGGMLLKTRMEVVRERRTIRPDFDESARFVEATAIKAKGENGFIFRQPVSVASVPDGTFWVAAYGSNELLHFDVNGVVIGRSRGSLTGFDRPSISSNTKSLCMSIRAMTEKMAPPFGERPRSPSTRLKNPEKIRDLLARSTFAASKSRTAALRDSGSGSAPRGFSAVGFRRARYRGMHGRARARPLRSGSLFVPSLCSPGPDRPASIPSNSS